MKLALLGRQISHSKSPLIYKYLFGDSIEYDLLDIRTPEALPSLASLKKNYMGINLTTPYKVSYIKEVKIVDPVIKNLQAINCIKLSGEDFLATNTDYLALQEILKDRFLKDHLILLGNGVMANLLITICREYNISHNHFHRTNGLQEDFDFAHMSKSQKNTTVINCCSRDFVYNGAGNREMNFWDMNYSHVPHQSTLPYLFKSYTDGQELLWVQARMAIKFWMEK